MTNTITLSDDQEARIVRFLQISVPGIFDKAENENDVLRFSVSFSGLIRKQYMFDDILIVRAANNVRGNNIVACLVELNWTSISFRLYKLNLLWFQEGYAFPINADIMNELRKLSLYTVGIEEESPF